MDQQTLIIMNNMEQKISEELVKIRVNQEQHNEHDDKRFEEIGNDIKSIKENHLAHIQQSVSDVSSDVGLIKNDILWIKNSLQSSSFITQKEFEPVKNIVYGGVALILIAVMGSIIGLVIIK